MESLNIKDTKIRLAINGDENRVIGFDPNSIIFVTEFHKLIKDFEKRIEEYQERAAEIDKNTGIDSMGVPENLEDAISLANEICQFICEKIDCVFGEKTSQTAFENNVSFSMIEQFFNGVAPYIQKVRTDKVEKYTRSKKKK